MFRKNICQGCYEAGHNRRTCKKVPYTASIVEPRPVPVPAAVPIPPLWTPIKILTHQFLPTYKTAEWLFLVDFMICKPPTAIETVSDINGNLRFKIRIHYGTEENRLHHDQHYLATYVGSDTAMRFTGVYGIQEGIYASEYVDRLLARA